MDQLNGSGTRTVSVLKEELELEEVIRELFSSQRLAVLGTQRGGQPYANLVAFAASDETLRQPWVERSARRICEILDQCEGVD